MVTAVGPFSQTPSEPNLVKPIVPACDPPTDPTGDP
jgi:hypothetical protein